MHGHRRRRADKAGAGPTARAAAELQGRNHISNHLDFSKKLHVDKMMSEVPGFRTHVETSIGNRESAWREQALAEFRRNGGRPVSISVETRTEDFGFTKGENLNWFFAVGSTRSNVTGVVTVVPDANGEPRVGLDYQANAWDRYNWDEHKAVTIDFPGLSGLSIPDGEMARLHTTGIAREFDMAGSSSVKHHDLGGATPNHGPLPQPDEPGRSGPYGPRS
ncbi:MULTISPECIES: hypothetical protein [unclassified Streptomyces]|uniref:hypothetical protein n=1 Tax=unclassified Streptomyces TaxID=2593676 RepID=UPI0008237B67|nr:hypothetical protein [Streptomyces sp. SID4919]SCK60462.1 hypothetical protein YW7DRAFT_05976 [Streptomyces sp. AmelKG-E11A]